MIKAVSFAQSRWAALVLAGWLVGCHGHGEGSHSHGTDKGHAHSADHGHGDDHSQDHGHGEEHGHGHGHGDEVAIGVTRWTDTLELFAEHPPAVVGKEMPFLAHLTILQGFQALTDAEVTLALDGDGPQPVSATVSQMLRPGIFRPVIVPRAPGKYQARLSVKGPAVAGEISGFTIDVYATEAEARAAQPAETGKEDEGISFLKEQQWQVPFATAFATSGTLVPTVEVAGEVETPPGGRAEIGSAVAGRLVVPVQGLPRPGQPVRAGQLLAMVAPAPSSPEDAARARLTVAEAEARVATARAAVTRAERLLQDRAISQRELEDARLEAKVAEEAVAAARQAAQIFAGAAQGRGAGIYRLMAPIDGVLTEVSATPGASVSPGQVLFRVINPAELWIAARVPEQDAARLRADHDAGFRIGGLDAWMPLDVTGDDANASVVAVSREVDPRSRTVKVIYALRAADERLRVGSLVRVSVPVGEPWQGVMVPRDAVLTDDGRDIVYVQVEGESFEERVVRLGPRAGGQVGIEQGVAAQERVVTRGSNLIRLAAGAAAAPAHGHVH